MNDPAVCMSFKYQGVRMYGFYCSMVHPWKNACSFCTRDYRWYSHEQLNCANVLYVGEVRTQERYIRMYERYDFPHFVGSIPDWSLLVTFLTLWVLWVPDWSLLATFLTLWVPARLATVEVARSTCLTLTLIVSILRTRGTIFLTLSVPNWSLLVTFLTLWNCGFQTGHCWSLSSHCEYKLVYSSS
jgi:hypothetical protein